MEGVAGAVEFALTVHADIAPVPGPGYCGGAISWV